MLYELRIYKIAPGRMDDFLAFFEGVARVVERCGIQFVAAWRTVGRDEFVWIRAFKNQVDKQQKLAAFERDEEWLELSKVILPA